MRTALEPTAQSPDTSSDGIDFLLAAQCSDQPRYDSWPGETRLALAVVEDAIMTVRATSGVRTPRARRLAAEAWAWIASRDTTHPYAFENLCDYLGLDAAWLRRGLKLAGHGPASAPRGARSSRRSARETARRSRVGS